jgi:hypothetical protein
VKPYDSRAWSNPDWAGILLCPYTPSTITQISLLKAVALYFDKVVILHFDGGRWATIGPDHRAGEGGQAIAGHGHLQTATPVDVLAKYTGPFSDPMHRDMRDQEFWDLSETRTVATGLFAGEGGEGAVDRPSCATLTGQLCPELAADVCRINVVTNFIGTTFRQPEDLVRNGGPDGQVLSVIRGAAKY